MLSALNSAINLKRLSHVRCSQTEWLILDRVKKAMQENNSSLKSIKIQT